MKNAHTTLGIFSSFNFLCLACLGISIFCKVIPVLDSIGFSLFPFGYLLSPFCRSLFRVGFWLWRSWLNRQSGGSTLWFVLHFGLISFSIPCSLSPGRGGASSGSMQVWNGPRVVLTSSHCSKETLFQRPSFLRVFWHPYTRGEKAKSALSSPLVSQGFSPLANHFTSSLSLKRWRRPEINYLKQFPCFNLNVQISVRSSKAKLFGLSIFQQWVFSQVLFENFGPDRSILTLFYLYKKYLFITMSKASI